MISQQPWCLELECKLLEQHKLYMYALLDGNFMHICTHVIKIAASLLKNISKKEEY